jgi:oxygen-independent coproporphyrinogen-3 oxidase
VTRNGNGIEQNEVLTEREAADEYLLMGLRLAEGIDMRRLRLDTSRVASLERQGLLTRQGNHLAATRQGRVVLERLILELAA